MLFFDKKPASETPWTKKLWIYDLRTNMHFTLKTNPLRREDLNEFVKCYNAENRHNRKPTWVDENSPHPGPLPEGEGRRKGLDSGSVAGMTTEGRWRAYTYDEIAARDKVSLDIFWLRDESLSDSDNLPDPDVIALEIVQDLEAALEQFREIAGDLNGVRATE
ncbi:MAG: type I restriction enzyme M protein [Gammaproteobacteria bacterium]|nr:MAG: type I restriction enzyme M protein [Gammaproteobacteria bacterium]